MPVPIFMVFSSILQFTLFVWYVLPPGTITTAVKGALAGASMTMLAHYTDIHRIFSWRAEYLGIGGGTGPGTDQSGQEPPKGRTPPGDDQPWLHKAVAWMLSQVFDLLEPLVWNPIVAVLRFLAPLLLAGVLAHQVGWALAYWGSLLAAEASSPKATPRMTAAPISVIILTVVWWILKSVYKLLFELTADSLPSLATIGATIITSAKNAKAKIRGDNGPERRDTAMMAILARLDEISARQEDRTYDQPDAATVERTAPPSYRQHMSAAQTESEALSGMRQDIADLRRALTAVAPVMGTVYATNPRVPSQAAQRPRTASPPAAPARPQPVVTPRPTARPLAERMMVDEIAELRKEVQRLAGVDGGEKAERR